MRFSSSPSTATSPRSRYSARSEPHPRTPITGWRRSSPRAWRTGRGGWWSPGRGRGSWARATGGAGGASSFGVNIRLPFEAEANPYVDDARLINFKYFFTRKLMFVKESDAFALFPGGFGTQDETYELLPLTQTV